jgi:hypothetical protein
MIDVGCDVGWGVGWGVGWAAEGAGLGVLLLLAWWPGLRVGAPGLILQYLECGWWGVVGRGLAPRGLGLAGLGWAGLGWAGLGWAGLGWAGLGWAGLGWAGLGWACLLEVEVGCSSPRGRRAWQWRLLLWRSQARRVCFAMPGLLCPVPWDPGLAADVPC